MKPVAVQVSGRAAVDSAYLVLGHAGRSEISLLRGGSSYLTWNIAEMWVGVGKPGSRGHEGRKIG